MTTRPTVLLHGFASSFAHGWVRYGWVELLGDEGAEAVAVELPGHGARVGEPVGDAAGFLTGTAARLAPHGEVDAVGFSAGALVLLRLAAHAPGLFRRIVLIGVGDAMLAGAAEQTRAIERALDEVSGIRGEGTGAREDAPGAGRSSWHRLVAAGHNSPDGLRAFTRSGLTDLSGTDLGQIRAEALFLTGSRDPAGTPDSLVAAVGGARFASVPGVDHFGAPGDPAVMGHVLDFLTR